MSLSSSLSLFSSSKSIYSFRSLFLLFKVFTIDLFLGFLWFCRALSSQLFAPVTDTIVFHELPQFNEGNVSLISGGAVKLKFLYAKYKRSRYRFNRVYLVSSCLPRYYLGLLTYCKLFGIDIVYNQNGTGYYAWSKESTLFINFQLSLAIWSASYVFYQSKFCKKAAYSHLFHPHLFINKPSQILFNPISLPRHSELANSNSGSLLKSTDIILFVVGSHHEIQRLILPLMLIEDLIAKPLNYSFKLVIAGRIFHDIKSLIHCYAPSSSFNIELFGAYDNNNLYDIFACKKGILLHLKAYDPSPTVPVEAMSYGIPVICSATGGMPEIVDSLAGINIDIFSSNDNKSIPPLSYHDSFSDLNSYYPTVDQLKKAVFDILQNYSSYSNHASLLSRDFEASNWLLKHTLVFNNIK